MTTMAETASAPAIAASAAPVPGDDALPDDLSLDDLRLDVPSPADSALPADGPLPTDAAATAAGTDPPP